MTSPAEQDYWPEFLRRLVDTPLAALSAEFQVEASVLDAALARTTGDRPVDREVWWPEVLRSHEQGSLRDLARRFGTNPRRLRRGLARAAVRVAGATIQEAGCPGLERIRERLGKEPDKTLAAEAGVTVEAVKGERRRLGIEPYRMRPDAEEWGERPPKQREKPRPKRRWEETPEPEIIRRATGSAPPVVGGLPGREGEGTTSARTIYQRFSPAAETDEVELPVSRVTSFRGLAGGGSSTGAALVSHDPGEAGARRRRIVRPSHPEAEEPPLPARAVRPPRAGVEIERAAAPPAERQECPVEPAQPDPATEPARKAMRAPGVRRVAGRAVRAVHPPEPSAEIAPDRVVPLDVAAAPAGTDDGRRGSPEPSAAPPPGAAYAWQVEIPGRAQPLLVVANDIGEAVRCAARHLGLEALPAAHAWRVGEVLREAGD